jgi:major membrane immunogen (membrane-anchored lipoprotein)
VLALLLGGCGSSDISNKIGDEAYPISLESFDGTKVDLEDYRGKTLYLMAWTTT